MWEGMEIKCEISYDKGKKKKQDTSSNDLCSSTVVARVGEKKGREGEA